MSVIISEIAPRSPAAQVGLHPGMELMSIGGHNIFDGLDYEFYSTGARLAVLARDGGKVREFTVEKAEYEPLGCGFATYLIDKQHACKNACVFCFIDQLPKGMRKELYFKDDDERLGFLFGNYVTLTNLTDREIERIIEMHIQPVNISVHTANPELRVQVMKNKRAGEVLQYIPRLADAGVPMNVQLVLVPGVNDGEELARSLAWLSRFSPAVQSIAAVPVGLTAHRQGLSPLCAYTAQTAAEQLDILLAAGDAHEAKTGARLFYPSDEFFLLAGRAIPPEKFYGDYPQLENGVGMWRLFHDEFMATLAESAPQTAPRAADLATGTLAAPLLETLAEALAQRHPEAKLHVHAVENKFFGGGVTVAGLLTGQDLAAALAGKLNTKTLLLPQNLLRADGDVMLDGMSPAALGKALGVDVRMVPQDGAALLDAALGGAL